MHDFNIREKTMAVRFDSENRFYTSLWNLREEVQSELKLPKHVVIRDSSLREGEQALCIVYTIEQKLKIARSLEEIGVAEIDCGLASPSQPDLEFLRAIKRDGLTIKTMVYAKIEVQNPQSTFDPLIEAGADVVNIVIHGTPISGFTKEQDYLGLVEESVKYIKKRGAFCSFLAPVTRWEFDFAEKVYRAALRGGADRVELGGAGLLGPAAFRFMVRWLKSIAGDKPVGIHSHNSLGTGTANAFIGVEEGAEIIDTSVHGFGNAGGMAATEEVVVGLSSIYGYNLGIKLEKLKELSDLMQEISGVSVWPYKTFVGDKMFVECVDTNLEKILREEKTWSDMFFLNPKAVGQRLQLLFGQSALAGRGIRAKAEKMGIKLNDSQFQRVVENMRAILKTQNALSEKEVENLIAKIIAAPA